MALTDNTEFWRTFDRTFAGLGLATILIFGLMAGALSIGGWVNAVARFFSSWLFWVEVLAALFTGYLRAGWP